MNLIQQFEGLSKTIISSNAKQYVSKAIEQGREIDLAEIISLCENLAKKLKEDDRVRPAVVKVLELHPNGKYTTASGAKIEIIEGGVSYDYSLTPEWVELDREEKSIKERKKALEERLKAIPAGKLLVDEETGETLIGPAKTSTTTYKVTLAK